MASGEGEGGEGWEAAVRAEVGAGWWDDPDGADLRARFKAFTGQRRDWPEPKLLFWRDLILRVSRRLRLCSAPAHLVSDLHLAREGSSAFSSDTMTATNGR
jgi:charged multivesicular body protein 7